MNYTKHYNLLMERAPKSKPKVGYFERHRILPGCMGGEYIVGNIAYLTPEEHYVAHQLLVKIHPDNTSLVYSARMMTRGRHRNNKLYGWLKRKHSAVQSVIMKKVANTPERIAIAKQNIIQAQIANKENPNSGSFKKGHITTFTGSDFTPEQLKRLSDSAKQRGIRPPSRIGSTITEEHKQKIIKANTGRPTTEKQRAALAKGREMLMKKKLCRPK